MRPAFFSLECCSDDRFKCLSATGSRLKSERRSNLPGPKGNAAQSVRAALNRLLVGDLLLTATRGGRRALCPVPLDVLAHSHLAHGRQRYRASPPVPDRNAKPSEKDRDESPGRERVAHVLGTSLDHRADPSGHVLTVVAYNL